MTAVVETTWDRTSPGRAPLANAGPRSPLGQRLVSANLIGENELETALSRQAESGQRLGETLLDMGLVTEEELLPYIESQLGAPAVKLREGLLDPQAVKLLPRQFAERLGVIALVRVGNELTVVTDDPLDLEKVDRIER
ncbi:MAG TPA: hypothetical protein PJ982_09645, partial [Lacipirellulaceae bacterium]|nr:hypothetical protein [Lacipirellulaceae bacterium]